MTARLARRILTASATMVAAAVALAGCYLYAIITHYFCFGLRHHRAYGTSTLLAWNVHGYNRGTLR